jgi:hypothetical protein
MSPDEHRGAPDASLSVTTTQLFLDKHPSLRRLRELFLRRATLYRSVFGASEEHNLNVYSLTKELERAL